MSIDVQKSTGDKLESLAFQFCKIATVALLAGRYTLLIAASLSSILFVWAYFKGKRESRCFLRYPLLIAGLWAIGAVWAGLVLWDPELIEHIRKLMTLHV